MAHHPLPHLHNLPHPCAPLEGNLMDHYSAPGPSLLLQGCAPETVFKLPGVLLGRVPKAW